MKKMMIGIMVAAGVILMLFSGVVTGVEAAGPYGTYPPNLVGGGAFAGQGIDGMNLSFMYQWGRHVNSYQNVWSPYGNMASMYTVPGQPVFPQGSGNYNDGAWLGGYGASYGGWTQSPRNGGNSGIWGGSWGSVQRWLPKW